MAQTSKVYLPTAAQWKQQLVEDIEMAAIDAGVAIPPTAKGSELDLKTTALGNSLAVLTSNLVIYDNDNNPETAEGDQLDEIRKADGLPESPATAATGKIRVTVTSLSPVTTPDGFGIICPGAQTAKLVGTTTGVTTGTELSFTMIKAGSAGNLRAGTEVRFTGAIAGLATVATVVEDMSTGADAETDAKKRRRIMNRRQVPPKADNPSRLRELALNATNAIDNAFVYPALGGGSTALTAVSAPWYAAMHGQSRTVGAGALAVIEDAYAAELSTADKLYVIKSTNDEPTDLVIRIACSTGEADFIDSVPFPTCETTVTAGTSTSFTISLAQPYTSAATIVGKNIAIWDATALAFRTSKILTATWTTTQIATITVSPWTGGTLTWMVGNKISPAAGNMTAWGAKLLDIIAKQTPGEACYAWQEPHALRYPAPMSSEPVGINARDTNELVDAFEELEDADIVSITTATPTRVSPLGNPNVLTLRHLTFLSA